MLDQADREGCTRFFVVGDIVNGIDPGGSLALLQDREAVTCMKGNAEAYMVTPDLDEFPDRNEPRYATLISLLKWFNAGLSESQFFYIQGLPDYVIWKGACFAHDSPLDRMQPEQWYQKGVERKYQELYYHSRGIGEETPEQDLQKLAAFMDEHALSHVFTGHTHVPFTCQVDRKVICNTGSVGMPLDGNPAPSWVRLEETSSGGFTYEVRRTPYDIEQILRMIDQNPGMFAADPPGRLEAYKMGLQTGMHWKNYTNFRD